MTNPYLKEISLILDVLQELRSNSKTLYSFQIFSDNSCVFKEAVRNIVLYADNPRELYELLIKENIINKKENE
jgi:hypothetical protein